jgi:rare lipoprotein A
LPCGTKVKVTLLENNKSVEVTIVERGPYLKGQVIALSSKAANEIGMLKESKVKVEVIEGNKPGNKNKP